MILQSIVYVIQVVHSMYFYFCFDLQERESWSKTKIALKCIKEIVVIVEAESFAAACRHQKLYFRGRPDDDFFCRSELFWLRKSTYIV